MDVNNDPRGLKIPAEFKKALDINSAAKKIFESLSYSRRKAHALPVANAKTDETRQRNIQKAITSLLAKKNTARV